MVEEVSDSEADKEEGLFNPERIGGLQHGTCVRL